MDFNSNFQGWMKFEQGAPDCTRITHKLMKVSLEIQIWGNFSNLCLKIQLGKTKFEFFLVYLELINHRVNA
jgi:hypothetical protein